MRGLLLIDHGSESSVANESLMDIVNLVDLHMPDWVVQGVHMALAKPDIHFGIESLIKKGVRDITAMPYMLSPGMHATDDIPTIVAKSVEKISKASGMEVTWRITRPLGVHDYLARLVKIRVQEAMYDLKRPLNVSIQAKA